MATAQATISRGFRSMPLPAIAAFTAMGLFIILIGFFGASSGFKSGAVPVGLLVSGSVAAVAFHVVMFLVVAAMPAPSWAKAAGYGWLVVDIACSVMTLNGVAASITTPLRYGGPHPGWHLDRGGGVAGRRAGAIRRRGISNLPCWLLVHRPVGSVCSLCTSDHFDDRVAAIGGPDPAARLRRT